MVNGNIEFYILVLISKNESFLLKIGEYLYTDDVKELTRKSYFDNRHSQTLFNLCYYIYTKTNKLATLRDIEFLVNNIFTDIDQKKGIMDVVNDVYKFDDEVNWSIIEEESLKFVKDRKFIEALTQSQKDMESKNYEAVIDRLQKSTQVSFDSDFGVDIKNWDNVKDALTEISNNGEVIPTGYDMLDSEKVLNGGFRPKEIEIVCANSGVGKTLFLCNFVANFILAGKKVLYLSMETSSSRLTSRIMANLMNLTTANIAYNLSESENDIKDQWEKSVANIPGELRIKEFATNSMNANQIETFILDLNKNTGFKPDVVCVDYLSICKPNDHKLSKENTYAYDKAITEDLRALAYKLNCVMLTAAQINRDGLKDGATKTIITTEDIANSLGIEYTADFIITLSQDKQHQKNRQLMAYIAKNRNAEKGQTMTLQITDTCRLVEVKQK